MPDNLEASASTFLALPHSFETELWCLVMGNHQLTLQGIARQQEEMSNHMKQGPERDDREVVDSVLSLSNNVCEELRNASRNLSLVGVVTRLQHWIIKLARQASWSEQSQHLPTLLRFMNDKLGQEGPVKVEFFEELVTVRDAIIHNDSLAVWEFRGSKKRVADRYVYGQLNPNDLDVGESGWELNLSETDLKEAVENSIAMIKWYDEKLNPHK